MLRSYKISNTTTTKNAFRKVQQAIYVPPPPAVHFQIYKSNQTKHKKLLAGTCCCIDPGSIRNKSGGSLREISTRSRSLIRQSAQDEAT